MWTPILTCILDLEMRPLTDHTVLQILGIPLVPLEVTRYDHMYWDAMDPLDPTGQIPPYDRPWHTPMGWIIESAKPSIQLNNMISDPLTGSHLHHSPIPRVAPPLKKKAHHTPPTPRWTLFVDPLNPVPHDVTMPLIMSRHRCLHRLTPPQMEWPFEPLQTRIGSYTAIMQTIGRCTCYDPEPIAP